MKATLLATIAVLALGAAASAQAGDIQAGKAKAAGCAGCHGANGEGVAPNPPLAGMPEKRFVQAMNDYKSGKRSTAMMKALAGQLSDADVDNLADYYQSLKKK
jgi:cytochrome c553